MTFNIEEIYTLGLLDENSQLSLDADKYSRDFQAIKVRYLTPTQQLYDPLMCWHSQRIFQWFLKNFLFVLNLIWIDPVTNRSFVAMQK